MRHALAILFLALTLTPSAAAAAPKSAPAPTADQLAELQELFDKGDCGALLPRVVELRQRLPKHIQLLVFEANCRLQQARTERQVFDSVKYDRLRVSRGAVFAGPAGVSAFYRRETGYDEAGRAQALALFREALAQDPTRPDLIVGNVAALAVTGKLDEAVLLLSASKGRLEGAVLADVGRVVQDLLAARANEHAARLAAALARDFPGSPAAQRAQGACALARRDTAAALTHLLALLAQTPGDAALARRVAPLLLYARRWTEVVTVTAPLASEGDDFQLWFALARMRLSPASATPVFTELAKRHQREGGNARLAELAQHYVRALSDPRRPTVAMRLRAANRWLQYGLPLPAVAELDDALAQKPQTVEAWKRLADIQRDADLPDLALSALDEALAAARAATAESPYSPAELEAERGRVLVGLERDREAAEALARARAGGRPAPFAEGLAALGLGDKGAALRFFTEAAAGADESAAWAKAKLELLTAPHDPQPGDR